MVRLVEPVRCQRAGRRHVQVEDLGEGRLVAEKRQERMECRPQRLLVERVGGQRADRRRHAAHHELTAFAGCGQEAILFVGEVRVKGRAGHSGSADDVGDGSGGVAGLGDGGYHGPQQPFAVRRLDGPQRQAVTAAGQTGFACVRAGESPLGPDVGHGSRVTGEGSTGMQGLGSLRHRLSGIPTGSAVPGRTRSVAPLS